MPMFRNFADYDKWRRRNILKKLRARTADAPAGSVVQMAAQAGDPSVPSANDAATAAGNAAQDAQIAERQANAGHPGRGFARSPSFKGGGASISDLQWVHGDGNTTAAIDSTLEISDTWTEMTMSAWVYFINGHNATSCLSSNGNATATRFHQATSGEQVAFRVENTTQSGVFQQASAVQPDSERIHVMMSLSYTAGPGSTPEGKIWVNGVQDGGTDTTMAGVGFGIWEDFWLFRNSGGGDLAAATALFSDLWIGKEYVADPVGVFIEAAQTEPVPLGGDLAGLDYTGNAPIIYMPRAEDWINGTNQGIADDFTWTGAGPTQSMTPDPVSRA